MRARALRLPWGAVLLLVLVGARAVEPDAVEREWRIRRIALDPVAGDEELRAAFASPEWTERVDALDACRRAFECGSSVPALDAATLDRLLSDDQGDVRARALECARLAGRDGQGRRFALDAQTARRLADDRLPGVRLALARALGLAPCAGVGALLAALAFDGDERVAHAARASLFGLPPRDEALLDARADALARLIDEGRDDELLRCALFLDRADAPDVSLCERVLAAWRDASRTGNERARGWSSVFAALALAAGPREDRAEVWLDALLAGWFDGDRSRPTRRAIQRTAVRGGGDALARAWLARAHTLTTEHASARGDALDAILELAELASTATTPERVVALASEGALPDEAWGDLLLAVASHVDDWSALDADAFLAPATASPARRMGTVRALHATVEGNRSTTARESARDLLARALLDPDVEVATTALWALCDVPDSDVVVPYADVLAQAWDALDEENRIDALGRLPRDTPLASFRQRLFALGAPAGDARVAAVEALRMFAGDAQARDVLIGWLEQDLALALQGDDAAAELRAQGELRTLDAFECVASSAEAREALERALRAANGVSVDIGKTAAAALGKSAPGRERLTRHLHDGIDRRVRIEGALALAPFGDGTAANVLMRDYGAAAWDLRVRVLRAFARAPVERGQLFLAGVASSEDEPDVERVVAIEALAAQGAVSRLDALLRTAQSFEVRRSAVRELARVPAEASAAARAALLTAFDASASPAGWSALDPALRLAASESAVLTGELYVALAAAGVDDERIAGVWLDAPLRAARATLTARFQGDAPPPPESRWWGELALARPPATVGELPWWRVDGELLDAFAVAVLGDASPESARAHALTRGAVVALSGFDAARARRTHAAARCRLLGLAWLAEDWARCERLARALLADYRAGALSASAWRGAFGSFDPLAEVDPVARLRAAAVQARAWMLVGDEREAEVARAEALLGRSRAARREQARLRASLGGASER